MCVLFPTFNEMTVKACEEADVQFALVDQLRSEDHR